MRDMAEHLTRHPLDPGPRNVRAVYLVVDGLNRTLATYRNESLADKFAREHNAHVETITID